MTITGRKIVCALVAGVLVVVALNGAMANVQLPKLVAVTEQGSFAALSPNLRQAIKDGRIKPDEFEKLDFTMPDDPDFGANPEYEVFNPESPRQILAGPPYSFDLPLFVPEKLNEITTVNDTQVFFNIRRNVKRGVTMDAIVAIIPNINKQLCEEKSWLGTRFYGQISEQLEFPIDLSQIVTDAEQYRSCVQMPNGDTYFFYPLVSRVKTSDRPEWR